MSRDGRALARRPWPRPPAGGSDTRTHSSGAPPKQQSFPPSNPVDSKTFFQTFTFTGGGGVKNLIKVEFFKEKINLI